MAVDPGGPPVAAVPPPPPPPPPPKLEPRAGQSFEAAIGAAAAAQQGAVPLVAATPGSPILPPPEIPPHPVPPDLPPVDEIGGLARRVGDMVRSGVEAIGNTGENVVAAFQRISDAGIVDSRRMIGELNSDGDQVVMSLTAEGRVQTELPRSGTPAQSGYGVGSKNDYGFEITIQQTGDSKTAMDVDDDNVDYEVTFTKQDLAGISGEMAAKNLEPKAEANFLRTADSVTMTFETREDAARAADALQKVARADAVRDLGRIPNGIMALDPAANPLADVDRSIFSQNSRGVQLPVAPIPAFIARSLEPSQEDHEFLLDHITEYSEAVGGQLRLNLGAEQNHVGVDGRADFNGWISRSVQVNEDGSGRITQSFSGEFDVSSKQKLNLGPSETDKVRAGLDFQNITDHGSLTGEVNFSYDLPPESLTPGGADGRPSGEPELLVNGELAVPDEISASFTLEHQRPDRDFDRTDLIRRRWDVTIDKPTDMAEKGLRQIFDGDIREGLESMGTSPEPEFLESTVDIDRSGFHHQYDLGIGNIRDVNELKAALIVEVGVDDVDPVRRSLGVVGKPPVGDSDGDRLESRQLVVLPRDGLNVREQPSTDGAPGSILQHGTFVQATGNVADDAKGQKWIEVKGPDVDDEPVSGWVRVDHVVQHPEGAMNSTGRINPDLQARGFDEHLVQTGDNIWVLARRNDVDIHEMVDLNSDHLIEPSLVFPGDTVYIPGTGGPEVTTAPPGEPARRGLPTE